jgi:hypothetical protein
MNYMVHGIALHPKPRHELSLKRSGVIPPEPAAGRPPIAVRARRRSLPRVLAALSVRRRWGGPPSPERRASATSGVNPIASGATRGVAFLVDR